MKNKGIIRVHTTPISEALEESFKFQKFALWVLGILLIININLFIWMVLK